MKRAGAGRFLAAMYCAVILNAGCASSPRWQATYQPDVLDAAALLAEDSLGLARDDRAHEVPNVPVRKRLRPCCGFGSGLNVRLGALPVPGIEIYNIRSPDEIGKHTYDAGRRGTDQIIGGERNGLVYTCRGGFIDTAHVRDYVDWTLYLASQIGRQLEEGGTIELPDAEGGIRRFVLEPVDPELIAVMGRRELAAQLAVWASFHLSVWHEIATWYGWSSFELFSERASAFSPEDLYSNMLGAKLAGAIISSGNSLSEGLFNQAVDRWIAQSLNYLEAVPAEAGEKVIGAVDGFWWDSKASLPDPNLVLKRSIQSGNRIEPWLVAEASSLTTQGSRDPICPLETQPHGLRNPSRIPGLDFAEALDFEIELREPLRSHADFKGSNGRVRLSDFPAILETIRQAARREFGEMADRHQAE